MIDTIIRIASMVSFIAGAVLALTCTLIRATTESNTLFDTRMSLYSLMFMGLMFILLGIGLKFIFE